jgi:hypothetical protein
MSLTLLNREEFDKLSNEEKRVAVARDVIKRLDLDLLSVQGTFFDERHNIVGSPQEFINSNTCHVCAKGAMICSWIGNFNCYSRNEISGFAMNFDDYENRSHVYPKELIEIFGVTMLNEIEMEFEGWETGHNEEEYECSHKYIKDLRGIMQNIIDNNGSFIP